MSGTGIDCWTHPAVILVATDLSDLDRLMPFALEQAGETGARLILLHVLSTGEAMTVDAVGMPYYDPSGAIEYAGKALQPWCDLAHARGLKCEGLVREGVAAQQISAAARQFKADRIMLCTRSRSKLGKLLIGSVAEQVLRSIEVPVVTIGPETHMPVDRSSGQRVVLHATTMHESSHVSAALACKIASSQAAKLVLLHVLPPQEVLEREGLNNLHISALHELQGMASELLTVGADCGSCAPTEAVVLHGNPAIEILAEASERKAGLIVLGATHRSAFENLTRDRTIYRVLAHARCPVLTLREPVKANLELAPATIAIHV